MAIVLLDVVAEAKPCQRRFQILVDCRQTACETVRTLMAYGYSIEAPTNEAERECCVNVHLQMNVHCCLTVSLIQNASEDYADLMLLFIGLLMFHRLSACEERLVLSEAKLLN
jgi:hypothetical protein